jgi:HK97 family phage prohead protease
MSVSNNVETRHFRVDFTEDRKIRGYAIVFNSNSVDLGGFRERILPQAVDRTFSEAIDVRALVDHDMSKIIGRKSAGTLSLIKDRKGLRIEIDPPDTTAGRDIVKSMERGDVDGISFAFRTVDDDWHEEDGHLMREVTDMRISEVSIVSFPAYPDTEVAMRSARAYEAQKPGMSLDWAAKVLRTFSI